MAFSPDGKTLLTSSSEGVARFWDVADRPAPRRTHQARGGVHARAFSPDGKTVLTGSSDKTARLWDAATGRPVGKPMTP